MKISTEILKVIIFMIWEQVLSRFYQLFSLESSRGLQQLHRFFCFRVLQPNISNLPLSTMAKVGHSQISLSLTHLPKQCMVPSRYKLPRWQKCWNAAENCKLTSDLLGHVWLITLHTYYSEDGNRPLAEEARAQDRQVLREETDRS